MSRDFFYSWICRPNLNLSEITLGLNGNAFGEVKQAPHFTKIVDGIMKKHSRIGVKTFTLQYSGSRIRTSRLNSWLQIAVTPGLEELVLALPPVPQPGADASASWGVHRTPGKFRLLCKIAVFHHKCHP